MIGILCKSQFLSHYLSDLVAPEPAIYYSGAVTETNRALVGSASTWLSQKLKDSKLSVVFYESTYFIDPTPFRSISPDTQFIFLSSCGESSSIETALKCGSSAFLEKPITDSEVFGVLDLVSS